VCVCVCMWLREREKGIERVREGALKSVCAFVSVCGCVGRPAARASPKSTTYNEYSTSLDFFIPASSHWHLSLPCVRVGVVVTPPAARRVAAPRSSDREHTWIS
jgi:hypothetical protein